MRSTETLNERQRSHREHAQLSFVRREEFCELLLSTRKVVRSDEPGGSIRGLLDLETGKRYLIEQEALFER